MRTQLNSTQLKTHMQLESSWERVKWQDKMKERESEKSSPAKYIHNNSINFSLLCNSGSTPGIVWQSGSWRVVLVVLVVFGWFSDSDWVFVGFFDGFGLTATPFANLHIQLPQWQAVSQLLKVSRLLPLSLSPPLPLFLSLFRWHNCLAMSQLADSLPTTELIRMKWLLCGPSNLLSGCV